MTNFPVVHGGEPTPTPSVFTPDIMWKLQYGELTLQELVDEIAPSVSSTQLGTFARKDSAAAFNVKEYGAVGNGTADDTVSIQNAVDAAYAAGGGTVWFPKGTYISTRITLKSKVILHGAGWLTSILKLKTGTNADFIVLSTVSTEQVGIKDLRINGNSGGNSSGNAIKLNNTAGVYSFSDPYHLFMNVFVENAASDGWNITSGLRESRFFNCHSKLAFGHGFVVAGTDNFFTDCTAATSGQSGWFISNGNNQFVSCKSFSNGFRCLNYGLEGDGFYLQNTPRNKFIGCEAQDNERYGFILTGASTQFNRIEGLLVDSNAVGSFLSAGPGTSTATGLVVDGCSKNDIQATIGNQRSTQDYGLQTKNTTSNNTIRVLIDGQGAGQTIFASANDIYVNHIIINSSSKTNPADTQPYAYGLIAWAYDPALAGAGTILISGTTYLTKLWLPSDSSVTNVHVDVTTVGAGLTAGQSFVGLYGATGNLLGVSADQSTSFIAAGPKTIALVGGPVAVPAGPCYVAIFSVGTTPPQLLRQAAASYVNLNLSAANSRFATADTGRTTTFANPFGTLSANSSSYWVAVS